MQMKSSPQSYKKHVCDDETVKSIEQFFIFPCRDAYPKLFSYQLHLINIITEFFVHIFIVRPWHFFLQLNQVHLNIYIW